MILNLTIEIVLQKKHKRVSLHQQHLIKGTRDKESKKGAIKEQLTTAQKHNKK